MSLQIHVLLPSSPILLRPLRCLANNTTLFFTSLHFASFHSKFRRCVIRSCQSLLHPTSACSTPLHHFSHKLVKPNFTSLRSPSAPLHTTNTIRRFVRCSCQSLLHPTSACSTPLHHFSHKLVKPNFTSLRSPSASFHTINTIRRCVRCSCQSLLHTTSPRSTLRSTRTRCAPCDMRSYRYVPSVCVPIACDCVSCFVMIVYFSFQFSFLTGLKYLRPHAH
jgi:hypothetical protein